MNFFGRIIDKLTRLGEKPWREAHSVGRHTYGNPTIYEFGEKAILKVGAYCSIADQVTILLGGEHRTDWITTFPFPAFRPSKTPRHEVSVSKGNVTIGNDVWIGFGVTILSGVTIGNGAVIGARSVVTKDVPPYAVAAGSPARVIRERFSAVEIAALERIAWWNWTDEKIDAAMPILLSHDVAALEKFARESVP